MPSPHNLDQSMLERLTARVIALEQWVRRLEALPASGDFVALDKTELTVDTATITFADIPGIYAALKIISFCRTDAAAIGDIAIVNFNNDVGANYDYLISVLRHSAVWTTGEGIAATGIQFTIVGDGAPANVFAGGRMEIPDYAGANHKSLRYVGERKTGTTTGNIIIAQTMGSWRDTDAITEIDITPVTGPNFLAGSKFYLYGLQASP